MRTVTGGSVLGVVLVACALSSALVAQAQRVSIEIKPGDDGPKTLEPGRGGMVPIAILGSPAFDAASGDPESVRLGPTGTEAAIFRSTVEDVDRDGDLDLLLLVRVPDLRLTCEHTELRLVGKTLTGDDFEGATPVQMTGCE